MIYFVLIRHGETSWIKQKRFQGASDIKLNARGRKQMQSFAKEITRYKPTVVFSSELTRCAESAQILCRPLKLNPIIDVRLNELDFGNWEGRTASQLVKSKNKSYSQWMKGNLVTPEGGESLQSLRRRVGAFIDDCTRAYDNKKVVIVTHGGPIRMFFIELLGLPMKSAFQFRIDPGTVTILGRFDFSTQLVLLNSATLKRGVVPDRCA